MLKKSIYNLVLNRWGRHSTTIEDRMREDNSIRSAMEEVISRRLQDRVFERALDVSCGVGYMDFRFKGQIRKLYCVDIHDHVDRGLLRGQFEKMRFEKYDGKTVPFEDGYFDLVWHYDVIEHVEDDASFLRENMRVLKKGGLLIFGTPNLNRVSNLHARVFAGKGPIYLGEDSYGPCIHVREYSRSHINKLCNETLGAPFQVDPCYFGFPPVFCFGRYINIGLRKAPRPLKGLCNYWLVSCFKK